jgi:hypothetical protein
MKTRIVILALLLIVASVSAGRSFFKDAATGDDMTKAAQAYLAMLDDDQLATSQMPYDSPERVGWHFIPKDHRKGLQIKHMNDKQRKVAHTLLRSSLSEVGYNKAVKIMELEAVLAELEKDRKGGPIRDAERYYFTVFGTPSADSKWGLSMEGHHLSLNFVVENGTVTSSTPTFFAANPTVSEADYEGTSIKKGTRVLAKEELLAFELVNSLNEEQRNKAIIADQAPREIRAAGEAQPPTDAPAGISYGKLDEKQQELLRQLVMSYARNSPKEIYDERVNAIKEAGPEKVHFAWAGATKEGIGHYYRIQGPTFLIEFVNTQPDAAGNPASHIHCVWRDMAGDFDIPIGT